MTFFSPVLLIPQGICLVGLDKKQCKIYQTWFNVKVHVKYGQMDIKSPYDLNRTCPCTEELA